MAAGFPIAIRACTAFWPLSKRCANCAANAVHDKSRMRSLPSRMAMAARFPARLRLYSEPKLRFDAARRSRMNFEDYKAIAFTRRGRVLTATLNMPDQLNAIA